MNMTKKILRGLVCRTLAMVAIVLTVVVSCTKANPYEGLSLVLSGVPENMTVGESAQVSVAFSGASSAAATYKWMSLNPTVVSVTSEGDKASLKALKGGRAVILVYLAEC